MFKVYKQKDKMDCGPACLKMVAKYYGRELSLEQLRNKCDYSKNGVSLYKLSEAAESSGFRTINVKVDFEKIIKESPLPFIAHWKQGHFIVVYKITRTSVHVADPAFGLVKYSIREFKDGWISSQNDSLEQGVCLLLSPTPEFYKLQRELNDYKSANFSLLLNYLGQHKKLILQLMSGMLIGSLIQLILPFLTQAIVDRGIHRQDISFIYVVLIAQVVLFISRGIVEFVRSWILLFIGQRINISMISDFLYKLMKMPLSFFDTKRTGDIMQRIGDHSRIEQFLTASTLNTLFSFFNLLIFGLVLITYSAKIFFVFMLGSIMYVAWTTIFLKRRRELDFKRFDRLSRSQNSLIQLIAGMQEIKLHNCENQKRHDWEQIQAKLFKINIHSLKLSQYQQTGAIFINEGKNIYVTFLSALAVIQGEISLGMMLSIQYIIGQMNSPIDQLVGFISSAQDAKISMERLTEIHDARDEQDAENERSSEFPATNAIYLEAVKFHYPGMETRPAVNNITLEIPEGKITAIVGTSGSGKTTLLKLLLGFYQPQQGSILLGKQKLNTLNQKLWRSRCGVVMQDGYVFSDTIERNVALGATRVDKMVFNESVKMACIKEFIESLPNGMHTIIGADGQGISAGQKQRLLIARAIYKSPEFIFFDEATNALDANNEKSILENLATFFKGRTVVVVAHRLSTVKNADQIIVMEGGVIVEKGTHHELSANKAFYYDLVKNQLELGN